MKKGFTLVELLVVLAIIAALIGAVSLAISSLVETLRERAQALELSRVEEAIDVFVVMDQQPLTPRETPALIGPDDEDAPFTGYLRSLPSRYSYSWTATGHVAQYLFEEADEPALTVFGNTHPEISRGILAEMQDYYDRRGRWARSWAPYCYTDLGLDADFWDRTIEGIHYGPNGAFLGLANRAGDDAQVYIQTLEGHELHLYDGWNVWFSAEDEQVYYHRTPRGEPGETVILVDLDTIRVEFVSP